MSTTATSPLPGRGEPGKLPTGKTQPAKENTPAITAKPVTWKLPVTLLALAGYALFLKTRNQRPPRWLPIAFMVLFVAAFLTWVVGGARTPSISLAGLIAGSVTLAVPLVFGSLSGVLCERVGVVNIAIEGQLVGGAFTAAMVATLTHNPFVGLLAAAIAGAAVSMVLALFSIKYVVNQIIVGVVLNVLVSGLTGFLFSTVTQLFGFADNLQSIVTIIGTPVPSQFMAMLPYLVTVLAVAGLVGRSRPPAASGIPYVKG